ncbi:MAG TPA: hypothetical protein PLP18_06855 [Smithellaceae bacterium]|nr:hypothetical protein [Smithellaceae bacterium]
MVIYAEARLGELLRDTPRIYVGSPKTTDNAQRRSLPPGISKQFSHQDANLHLDLWLNVKCCKVAQQAFSKSANLPTYSSVACLKVLQGELLKKVVKYLCCFQL